MALDELSFKIPMILGLNIKGNYELIRNTCQLVEPRYAAREDQNY